MKKIYESPLNGWDESAERVYVYALENEEEFWMFADMTFDEKCEFFGVTDQLGSYGIAPGAMYYSYNFDLNGNHIVMYETVAYNV